MLVPLLLTLLQSASPNSTPGAAAWGDPDVVEVVRDAFGVPHVFARTDAGAYYGLGWAAAEDRFFQMSYQRLAARGRTAEFLGRDPGDGSDVYLNHDLETRLLGLGRLADAIAAAADPEVRALLEAYAQGVNDHVAQAADLHPNFAQFGIPVEPWTPSDSVAIWLRFGRTISSTPATEVEYAHLWEALIAQGVPPAQAQVAVLGESVFDEEAAVVQQADVPAKVQQQMSAFAASLGLGDNPPPAFVEHAPHFSQAWAVGGSATSTGETVVFADPRFPLRVPNELWEAHAVGATFEARGAAAPGSPNLLFGATPKVAWTLTASGMDQVDLFEIVTDPAGHPGEYELDGQWIPFELDTTEAILVAGEAPVVLPYRETVWGPVVTRFPGDTLVQPLTEPDEEFSLRWAPAVRTDLVSERAFLDIYRAQDAKQFGTALRNWSTPAANCVFGDDSGTVGYWLAGALPVRSATSPLGGGAVQDGSSTSSAWLAFVPNHLKPWVLDPAERRVLSANHLPVGSWYPIPLVSHGGYSSRARRLRELLDLTFPTPTSVAPPDVVANLHGDGVWVAARDVVRLGVYLRDVQGWPLSAKSLNALVVLEPFADPAGDGVLQFDPRRDGTLTPAAPKASALAYWNGRLAFRSQTTGGKIDPDIVQQYGFGDEGFGFFLRTLVAQISQTPPVDLKNREAQIIDAALIDGWNKAIVNIGPVSTWADWYLDQHLSQDLERWRSIDGLPSLLPDQGIPVGPVGIGSVDTLQSQYQQAYTQYTRLGGPRVLVRSLLPLGQSERDASPHFDDQRAFWEVPPQYLKPEPFDRDELVGPLSVVVLGYPGEGD